MGVELIDLRMIYFWDKEMVFKSVRKMGWCVVVYEVMVNVGVGVEVVVVI